MKRALSILSFALFVGVLSSIFAPRAEATEDSVRRDAPSVRDVKAIVAGKDGKVWFTSREGLLCFDGKTWQT